MIEFGVDVNLRFSMFEILFFINECKILLMVVC